MRETFRASRVGTIAGCMVTSGVIRRGANVRVVRDGTVVYTTTIDSLKRFQDDVREVQEGFECGIHLANYNDVKVGDVLEVFETARSSDLSTSLRASTGLTPDSTAVSSWRLRARRAASERGGTGRRHRASRAVRASRRGAAIASRCSTGSATVSRCYRQARSRVQGRRCAAERHRCRAASSGVLLHVTSLPGGRLGQDAYEFVDWLEEAGQTWWQVLPLNPPDAFGSPYTSSSAFAGWRGLLAEPGRAGERGRDRELPRAGTRYWADDWERYAGAGALADQVRFEREWSALRRYAAERGVQLIGDIPIYVAEESAEVAAHPELFSKDLVAGAAPDVSHPEGQLWGQPVYDWRAMRREGYRWWIERFRRTLELVDVARVDHFRGFVAYWAVPRGATSPLEGRWHRGPGAALFQAVERRARAPAADRRGPRDHHAGGRPRCASELGLLGMRIVGRGFVKRHRHRHAVAAHPEDAVVYTGTHDHPTIAEWLATASAEDSRSAHADLAAAGIEDDDLEWALVRLALSSRARIAILPMQDVLGLGAEARMNHPGTVGNGNWQWRLEPGQLTAGARRAAARGDRREPAARAGAAPRARRPPERVRAGYVGILSVELHFPEAGSLKGKRKHVLSAKAQLQNRFGASVAEVDHHDSGSAAAWRWPAPRARSASCTSCSTTPSAGCTARTGWSRGSSGGSCRSRTDAAYRVTG